MINNTVLKKTETASAIISLQDNGIVRVLFKSDIDITPEQLKINFTAYNSIVKGKKHPFLISPQNGFVNYTDEARTYAKEHEEDFPKICIAMVGTNLAYRLVVKFYLRYNKPKYPHKLFDKIEDAEAWCLEHYLAFQEKENVASLCYK